MKLFDKYSFNPSTAFDAIDQELAAAKQRLAELQEKVAELYDGGGGLPAPILTKWAYEVTDPVFFSDNFYHLEEAGSRYKRWVGPKNSLELPLRLRRDLSYTIEIDIIDTFSGGEFHTSVDGVEIKNKAESGVLSFSAPSNEIAFSKGGGLNALVWVDEKHLRVPEEDSDDTRTLAFSLAAIRVTPNDL